MISVDTGSNGVTIQSVETLYASFDRMDVPAFYTHGGQNPFEGLCSVIPPTASFYALVPDRYEDRLTIARKLLKGLDRRRNVREVIREKHEVNYNQFEKTSKIVVLYV
jgi:hypothetical protein